MSKNAGVYISHRGGKFNLLSWTMDMQAWSFSLMAGETCPGRETGTGSVCDHCYAHMNSYNIFSAYKSQMLRTDWTRSLMRTAKGRAAWVAIMVGAIRKVGATTFRGHDSGDFFSVDYIQCWHKVCAACPDVRFWFPTRSYKLEKLLPHLCMLGALMNVSVRPSAMYFDTPVPEVHGLAPGMGVVTAVEKAVTRMCPKSTTPGGNCEKVGCRLCWGKTETVSFLVHGFAGKQGEARPVSENMYNCRTKFKKSISLTLLPV